MTRMADLIKHGQSCWIDAFGQHMLRSGELARRVREEDLRGVTSNPTIFEKAIVKSHDYDDDIARLADSDCSPTQIYEDLVTSDMREACDILRPVYDRTGGVDGYVSLEVSPHLA